MLLLVIECLGAGQKNANEEILQKH